MRRSTFVRRSAVAATAVSLALLVTACGGETKDDAAPEETAKAGSSAPAADAPAPEAEVLSADELEKALVTTEDLPNYSFREPTKADKPESHSADKAECAPITDLLSTGEIGKPGASAATKGVEMPKEKSVDPENFDVEKAFDLPVSMVTLSSYEGKGAQESFAAVTAAATACADGFELTQEGEKFKVAEIEEMKVAGGEETGGWAVTVETEGAKMVFKTAVARQGASLAVFSTVNMTAVMTGKDFDFPVTLVEAQVEKLAKQG